jgi:hypothetical protein
VSADFSVKPGKVEENRTTFTAKTFVQGWKNQRRRRREMKRMDEEEKSKEEGEPSAKKSRTEEVRNCLISSAMTWGLSTLAFCNSVVALTQILDLLSTALPGVMHANAATESQSKGLHPLAS